MLCKNDFNHVVSKGSFHSGGVLIGVERGRSSINIYARNRGESEPFCFSSWACFYLAQVLLGLVSMLIGELVSFQGLWANNL